jgi:hypothetical protein
LRVQIVEIGPLDGWFVQGRVNEVIGIIGEVPNDTDLNSWFRGVFRKVFPISRSDSFPNIHFRQVRLERIEEIESANH